MNRFIYTLSILGFILISGCVPSHGSLSDADVTKNQPVIKENKGFSYVKNTFAVGKVMKAYQAAQAMDSKDKDYANVRLFLKKKINPARIRLLRHYKKIAIKARHERNWYKAWVNYKQTAEFSAKPEVFDSNIAAMHLHRQQLRLNVLLKQRRLEDHALLLGMKTYVVPKGVAKHDVVFLEFEKQHKQMLEQRGKQAYLSSDAYVTKKKWVAAYVLIESHLRLMPDSTRGEKLLHTIQKAWLKGLIIPKGLRKKHKPTSKKKTTVVPIKNVKKVLVLSKADIQALLKQHKWSEAQDAALVYQHHDGEGGENLLQNINSQIQQLAKKYFQQGGIAFQQEHIDKAVQLWDEAVQLDPENEEYLDALNRALSLQERLDLLRHQK